MGICCSKKLPPPYDALSNEDDKKIHLRELKALGWNLFINPNIKGDQMTYIYDSDIPLTSHLARYSNLPHIWRHINGNVSYNVIHSGNIASLYMDGCNSTEIINIGQQVLTYSMTDSPPLTLKGNNLYPGKKLLKLSEIKEHGWTLYADRLHHQLDYVADPENAKDGKFMWEHESGITFDGVVNPNSLHKLFAKCPSKKAHLPSGICEYTHKQ